MRFELLDILPGLEDAFNKAVTIITHGGSSSLRGHVVPFPARRYDRLGARSILIKIRKAYQDLNQDRQKAWKIYGASLGLGAYQAFVQYNYSRISQGVLAERFPPLYPGNKVKNFDMFGNPPQYWTLGPAGVFYGNGHVSVIENDYLSDTLICKQDLILLPNTSYQVSFEYHTYDNAGGIIKFGLGSQRHSFNADDYTYEGQRVSFTFTTPGSSGLLSLPVIFLARGYNYPTYINNVSVVEV